MTTAGRRKGFTLPEILVTVTVVAVLAAVVVPAVTQYVGKGDVPATQNDLVQFRNAITAYVADTRKYPGTFYDLESQPAGLASWKGPYTTAPLTGVTGAGTFTSSGVDAKLGPAIANAAGYLTTPFAYNSASKTCQDLWTLDKAMDGGTGLTADNATMATSGNLVWTGGCNNPGGAGTSAPTALVTAGPTIITFRLLAIGT